MGLVDLFDEEDVNDGKVDVISSVGHIAAKTIKNKKGTILIRKGEKIMWHHMLLLTHFLGDDAEVEVDK